MNYSAIAVRYSKALFSLATEKNILDEIQEDVRLISSICQSENDFIRLLGFPTIPATKKIEIFRIIFEKKIRPETLRFLELIAKKRRESHLPAMAHSFLLRFKETRGVKTITFTSVELINDSVRTYIHDLIKKLYKANTELIEQQDEKLIGGFVLRIDDEQYDASVASQLEKIKREFIH
jgi:F-type H+-transporting ATPase subunit delta